MWGLCKDHQLVGFNFFLKYIYILSSLVGRYSLRLYIYIYIKSKTLYICIKSKGIYQPDNLMSNGSSRHDDAAQYIYIYIYKRLKCSTTTPKKKMLKYNKNNYKSTKRL